MAGTAFYLFLVHTFTATKPFVNPRLFADRNFSAGLVFIFLVGIILLATLALLHALSAEPDGLSGADRRAWSSRRAAWAPC